MRTVLACGLLAAAAVAGTAAGPPGGKADPIKITAEELVKECKADRDKAEKKYKGKTLLDLCNDPKNVDPAVWLEFYRGVPGTNPGALPFRVASLKTAARSAFRWNVGSITTGSPSSIGSVCRPAGVSTVASWRSGCESISSAAPT